jgi:hypothetical protein
MDVYKLKCGCFSIPALTNSVTTLYSDICMHLSVPCLT